MSAKVKEYLANEKKNITLCYKPAYSDTNSLTVTYNNVGSIRKKWQALSTNHHLAASDIVFFAETWLCNESSAHFYRPDCDLHCMDSVVVPHHRGMLMFVSRKYKTVATKICQTKNLEMMSCTLPWKEQLLHIIGIYKPPQANYRDFISDISCELQPIYRKPLVLMGDFNIDCSQIAGKKFTQMMAEQFGLMKCVTEQATWAGTCIDLVFTNMQDLLVETVATTWSTHNFISANIPL